MGIETGLAAIAVAPNSTLDSFSVTGQASKYGRGTLLRPGMNADLDRMMRDDHFIKQLGEMAAWNQKYGVADDGKGGAFYTEMFTTFYDNPAITPTTDYGLSTYVPDASFAGRPGASVQPTLGDPANLSHLMALGHTHPFNGVPSDGHDFAWEQPAMAGRNLWSIVVTPSQVYFTGPSSGQFYRLPTSDFRNAGKANNTTVASPY